MHGKELEKSSANTQTGKRIQKANKRAKMKCLSIRSLTIEIKGTVHPIGPLGTADIANIPFALLPKTKNQFNVKRIFDTVVVIPEGAIPSGAISKLVFVQKNKHSTTAALNLFYESPYLNFFAHSTKKPLDKDLCCSCKYMRIFKKCKISLTLSCFVPNNSYQSVCFKTSKARGDHYKTYDLSYN